MGVSIDRVSWDDLKLLLAVAATGSVRGAAREMRLSVNTVRSRLDVMENASGLRLVERSARGISLTEAGLQLRQQAERMRAAAEATVATDPAQAARTQMGSIRLSLTEGLAAYWMMPRLADFQRKRPDAVIHLRTDARATDQALTDVDVAVQLRPPSSGDFHVEEVGTLHLMPFASPAYLEKHGTPKHFDEWRAHRLVWQDWEPDARDIMPLFIADDAPQRMIAMVTASTSAQLAAIAAGRGLGFLPTYMAWVTDDVRPVDFGMQFRRTVYLIVRSSARSDEVDELARLIRSCFADERLFGDLFSGPDPSSRFRQAEAKLSDW